MRAKVCSCSFAGLLACAHVLLQDRIANPLHLEANMPVVCYDSCRLVALVRCNALLCSIGGMQMFALV